MPRKAALQPYYGVCMSRISIDNGSRIPQIGLSSVWLLRQLLGNKPSGIRTWREQNDLQSLNQEGTDTIDQMFSYMHSMPHLLRQREPTPHFAQKAEEPASILQKSTSLIGSFKKNISDTDVELPL